MIAAVDRPRWPNQIKGHRAVLEAFDAGHRCVCLTSPTGTGKTVMIEDVLKDFLAMGKRCVLYSNRKLLINQLSESLERSGIKHGIRSPEHDDERHYDMQISSIQTETKRWGKLGWELHDAQLAIIDEAHLNAGESARKIRDKHLEAGAYILGPTATPIDLGDFYDVLITAGNVSEGRACGALLLASHYSPDEPDWKAFKKEKEAEDAELGPKVSRSLIMTPGVFGRVLDAYRLYNPDQRPTILFGPDVAGSLYFAEQFELAGIPAAHIDGDDVWAHGRLYKSSQKVRESVIEAVRDGRCKVVCNRFVLREGLDIPELAHCIFATVFGSLSSYIQSGGRLLRYHPSLNGRVTVQDHGGHWWRFGSLNADRIWHLGATNSSLVGQHADNSRKMPRPRACPKCRMVQVWRGPVCSGCGYEMRPGEKVSRAVVQTDGTLREMTGDVWKPRRICQRPDGAKKWKAMYFRSLTEKAKGRTFRAAAALFAYENDWAWPDEKWPYMPTNFIDWYRPVRDVPQDTLTQE